MIYRSDGYIITNHHVVEGEGEVHVAFADGTTERGEVVGTDPTTEIAVIKVDRDDLPAASVDEEDPLVGQMAVAVDRLEGGGPAADAGLERSVVVAAAGSQEVRSSGDLLSALRDYRPGETVELTVLRDGEEIRLSVRLGERPR